MASLDESWERITKALAGWGRLRCITLVPRGRKYEAVISTGNQIRIARGNTIHEVMDEAATISEAWAKER